MEIILFTFGDFEINYMAFMAAIRIRYAGHGLRTLLAVLLLTFYVAGTSGIEGLHHFFHSHNHLVAHSEAQESDPCHRSIYHHQADKGCGHHSHLIVRDKCELCDLLFHTDEILLSSHERAALQFFAVNFGFYTPDVLVTGQLIHSSRAPPEA
jgi:hypothetical protein